MSDYFAQCETKHLTMYLKIIPYRKQSVWKCKSASEEKASNVRRQCMAYYARFTLSFVVLHKGFGLAQSFVEHNGDGRG